jgi:hypothetical protein
MPAFFPKFFTNKETFATILRVRHNGSFRGTRCRSIMLAIMFSSLIKLKALACPFQAYPSLAAAQPSLAQPR